MRLRLQRTVREIDQVAGFRWARGEKLRRVVFGAASGGPRLVSWSIVDVAQSTALLLRRLRDYGLGRGHDGGDRGRDPYCSAGRRSHRTATCSQAPCRRLWNPLGPNFRRSGGSAIQAPRTPLGIGIIVRPERSEPAEAHRRRRCCRRARDSRSPVRFRSSRISLVGCLLLRATFLPPRTPRASPLRSQPAAKSNRLSRPVQELARAFAM